jgi:hypothetical protein
MRAFIGNNPFECKMDKFSLKYSSLGIGVLLTLGLGPLAGYTSSTKHVINVFHFFILSLSFSIYLSIFFHTHIHTQHTLTRSQSWIENVKKHSILWMKLNRPSFSLLNFPFWNKTHFFFMQWNQMAYFLWTFDWTKSYT